jgi:death-on-curing family protein
MNYLTLEDFEDYIFILNKLYQEGLFDEPVPGFDRRYHGKLESILAQIQANYFGRELYRGLVNKAAWMFYCLITNHPFQNGNKRIALLALFYFLKRNTYELYINERDLFVGLERMAIKTSESTPDDQERILRYLKRKIRSFIINY